MRHIYVYTYTCTYTLRQCSVSDKGSQGKASPSQWITAESLFILVLYIISHFGKLSVRRTRTDFSFLSLVFTSVSAEMENVGNSLKCLDTKLVTLRAKAICDAR
jgi:hypothetical protein